MRNYFYVNEVEERWTQAQQIAPINRGSEGKPSTVGDTGLSTVSRSG